jgi:hypothetical protein
VVYQVLLAEVALQRGKNEFASQAYADLAVRSRDPAILQRAIEVAGSRASSGSGARTRPPVG